MNTRLARNLADYSNPDSLGCRLRAARVRPLLDMIEAVYAQRARVDLLDVGGVEAYWSVLPPRFLEEHSVKVTVLNLPGDPKPEDHGPFEFALGDGCSLDMFERNHFDIAHSNSVIEHVGEWERVEAFAREISRVAPNYFVQTPCCRFPIEPHSMTPFFHWMPRWIQLRLIRRWDFGWWYRARTAEEAVAVVDSTHLLSKRQMSSLFGDAHIVTERWFGLPKSLIAIR